MNITIDNHKFVIKNVHISNHYLATCTLFKDDYKNTNLYVNYYYKYHNIKQFYLYYNGDLTKIQLQFDIPKDCYVHVFQINYEHMTIPFGLTSFHHNAQFIQLTHSSILASYYNEYLLNVDLDEYISTEINLTDYLKKNDYDVVYFEWLITKCGGTLCKRDYDYSVETIKNTCDNATNIEHSPWCKFVEKSSSKQTIFRCIHDPIYSENRHTTKLFNLYHIQCLSHRHNCKRLCC